MVRSPRGQPDCGGRTGLNPLARSPNLHWRWCALLALAVLGAAHASLNLFATVLLSWVRDRALPKRAAKLWEALPLPYRHLLNAIFWDDNRAFIKLRDGAASAQRSS